MSDKWSYIDSRYARPASGERSVRPTTKLTNAPASMRGVDWRNESPRSPRTHLSGRTAEMRRVLVRHAAGKKLSLEERVLLSKLRPR